MRLYYNKTNGTRRNVLNYFIIKLSWLLIDVWVEEKTLGFPGGDGSNLFIRTIVIKQKGLTDRFSHVSYSLSKPLYLVRDCNNI